MIQDKLNDEYFNWMHNLVCDKVYRRGLSYLKLLRCLHDIVFSYSIPMDGNREADGIDLRYRFGYEKQYDDSMIANSLDNRPCSVLEMMIALAFRCEEHIMDDPEEGNRTGKWFWDMIENLGLKSMIDDIFDKDYVTDTVNIFLNREYARNGEGGLFKINSQEIDMRSVEIWYQMCWYLDIMYE